MKKLFTMVLAASAFAGFAQKNEAVLTAAKQLPIGNQFADKSDSLLQPAFLSDTSCGIALYTTTVQGQPGGFVTGVNVYGDLEKGQIFQGVAGAKVDTTIAFVGAKLAMTGAGANDTYVAKLYTLNLGADTTLTLLGTSQPVAFANIDTNVVQGIPSPTFFVFNPAVPVPGTFVINYEVAKIVNDTITSGIAIYSSTDGCGGGAIEVWNDGNVAYMSSAWGADIDLLTFVSQKWFASIDENVLSSFSVYPNPASATANFAYTLKNTTKVNFRIINVAGQTVMSLNEGTKGAGSYTTSVDVSSLSNGVYFYAVDVNGVVSKGKFVVSN